MIFNRLGHALYEYGLDGTGITHINKNDFTDDPEEDDITDEVDPNEIEEETEPVDEPVFVLS